MKKLLIITAILAMAPALRAEVIAYWPFGVSGTADATGNYTLLNQGVEIGASAVFDGNQTQFQTSGGLNLGDAHAMTIECFVKYSWADNGPRLGGMLLETSSNCILNPGCFDIICCQIGDTISTLFVIDYSSNAFNGHASSGAVYNGTGWHHLALVIDMDEKSEGCTKLYMDGVLDSSFPDGDQYHRWVESGTLAFPVQTLYVGARNNDSIKFIGEMDDIRISNAALTPEEFLQSRSEAFVPEVESTEPIFDSIAQKSADSYSATISYVLSATGDRAGACDVTAKIFHDDVTNEVVIAEGLTAADQYEYTFVGLHPAWTYGVILTAVNGGESAEITGSVTTMSIGFVIESSDENDWPLVAISDRFAQGKALVFYRASSPTGRFRKFATVPAGTLAARDRLETYGRYYYKVARLDDNGDVEEELDEIIAFNRCHPLLREEAVEGSTMPEGASVFCYNGLEDHGVTELYSRNYAFDGCYYGDGSGSNMRPGFWNGATSELGNPALGVDFGPGRRVGVGYIRGNFMAEETTAGHVCVFGSNSTSDDPAQIVAEAEQISSTPSNLGAWWFNFNCTSGKTYRYVFMMCPEGTDPSLFWAGAADELRFYGWSEGDYPAEMRPFAVIVR